MKRSIKHPFSQAELYESVQDQRIALARGWNRFEDRSADLFDSVAKTLGKATAWAKERPLFLRWGLVVFSVFVSLLIGASLSNDVTASSQLLLLLPAVLVSALYSGLYAGTIAALLGAVATVLLKMTPVNGSLVPDFVGLVLYGMACGIVLGLTRAQENQRSQIVRFAETLEGKIHERTSDLEAANEELSGFCYSISHDLRAPMRNIVASSRILLEDSGDLLEPEAKDRLVRLANSANKLATWVDDLLKHARLGHMELRPEWVDVTKMVDELCTQLQSESLGANTFSCRVQPNLVATGDRVLMRLALRSLLENSCKYAQKGRPLEIEVGERRVGRITYQYVRDNGIGFEPQYAKKIFKPFERLHRDEEIPGSGIGLANVMRIIERHGGEIFAEGKPGEGATFLFRFGSAKKRL